MQAWIKSLKGVMYLLLGRPQSPLEQWAVLGFAVLICFIVLVKSLSALDAKNTNAAVVFVSAVIGVLLVVAAMAVASVFILPRMAGSPYAKWAVPGTAAAVMLIIAIPITCLLNRANYMAGLISWALTAAAVAGAVTIVGMAFDAVASGKRDASKAQERKQAMEEYIDLLGQ